MLLSRFDYHLPPELIAQHPAEPRDHSRLMVLDRRDRSILHRQFYDITEYLRPGDLLVINNTKVFPARLVGEKQGSGGRIEFFLLLRIDANTWEALVGGSLKPGRKAVFGGGRLTGEVVEALDEAKRVVRLSAHGCPDIDALIREVGQTPLPPYIERQPDLQDISRYQTVFAREEGAVAAPTAGLHFTPELLQKIADMGVETAEVTLHVGAGTFMPVKVERIEDHVMHPEWYRVSPETAAAVNRTKARGGRVIAVGSTSTRTLETVADANGLVHAGEGWSSLFIIPGGRFKTVDAMITNFHLPKSTLLMMVAAFAGLEFMLNAYDEAVREKYRFYSYGDAMLVL